MQKFLSQGLNLRHSSDLSHSNDTTGSLTHSPLGHPRTLKIHSLSYSPTHNAVLTAVPMLYITVHDLFYFILFYFILFYSILFYFILFYFILFYYYYLLLICNCTMTIIIQFHRISIHSPSTSPRPPNCLLRRPLFSVFYLSIC